MFNQYFVDIGQTLSNNIQHPAISFTSYLPIVTDNNLLFTHVTELEITRILNDARASGADHDGLPMLVLKQAASVVSPLLAHLCNTSLLTGCFPDPLKIARITPIHKSGPRNLLKNYRPISVLPSVMTHNSDLDPDDPLNLP